MTYPITPEYINQIEKKARKAARVYEDVLIEMLCAKFMECGTGDPERFLEDALRAGLSIDAHAINKLREALVLAMADVLVTVIADCQDYYMALASAASCTINLPDPVQLIRATTLVVPPKLTKRGQQIMPEATTAQTASYKQGNTKTGTTSPAEAHPGNHQSFVPGREAPESSATPATKAEATSTTTPLPANQDGEVSKVDVYLPDKHEAAQIGTENNLTGSLGFTIRMPDGTRKEMPIAGAYQTVLNEALTNVRAGMSYAQATRMACQQLSDSGINAVSYYTDKDGDIVAHRTDTLEVAVMRALRTAITQIAAKEAEQAMKDINTPYCEVTAHRGARDKGNGWQNHKYWQGKVYSTAHGDKYPNLHDVTGYGEVDGLCGVNCRHLFSPWVEGISERTYTDEQLAKIDPPPFEFDGKTYTTYEATQMQRKLENTARKLKRRIVASKAAGLSTKEDYAKLRSVRDKYRSFSTAAGLREQYDERASVWEFNWAY